MSDELPELQYIPAVFFHFQVDLQYQEEDHGKEAECKRRRELYH